MSTPWLLRIDGADVGWFADQSSGAERAQTVRMRSPRRRAEHAASRVLVKFAYVTAKQQRNMLDCRWRLVESAELRRSSLTVDMSGYVVVGSNARSGPPSLYDVTAQRYEHGLSISHKWPFVAVSYAQEQACGVDIERVGSIPADVESYYLPEAADRASPLTSFDREERNTLLWTIKEATFKALRIEGRAALQDVRIADIALEGRSQDGATLDLAAVVRLAERTATARVRCARFGRTFCSEVCL